MSLRSCGLCSLISLFPCSQGRQLLSLGITYHRFYLAGQTIHEQHEYTNSAVIRLFVVHSWTVS